MRTCPSCPETNLPTARFCQGCGSRLISPQPTEMRKLATVIFCDLAGSTQMGEGLDVEALRRFIKSYFDRMTEIITGHGGVVEKFIGDAVVGVFGVPVLREDDALRAVRAAWAMQQAMQEMTVDSPAGSKPMVRIGVNTGEVMAGDPSSGHGFVSGDPMNVAARLEQAAPPGEIYLGPTTYRMVRDYVEAETTEPLELKGKSDPVPAFVLTRLVERPAHPGDMPTKLVGRAAELSALVSAFEETVATERGAWVTVTGEAGVGKSALIDGFKREVGARALILEGRCLSYGDGITFWPIAEIIKSAAGITSADAREEANRKLASLALGLADAELVSRRIAAALALTEEVASTQEIFWAIRVLLAHLASVQPVVVVVDDLHWAEDTLLDVIEYLASFSAAAPMLVLSVGRSQLLERRPTWFARTMLIPLPPLGPEHVKELLGHSLGALPEEVEREILTASQGNPLYVQEIAKMVREEGEMGNFDASDLWTLSIPPTIQALLSARLEQLPFEEQSIVQNGSVIGREFWSGALEALSTDELRHHIGKGLQALVRREVLLPTSSEIAGEDGFGFAHILMRDAAYAALPKERRAQLHEKAAEWLNLHAGERLPEYEEVLAYHLEQAALLRRQIGETGIVTATLAAKAAEFLLHSGRRAAASGDVRAASSLLRRASALLNDDDPRKAEAALELSAALTETGDLKRAGEATEQAAALGEGWGDPRVAARARLQMRALEGFTDHTRWVLHAERELQRSIEEMEQLGDELGQARALHLLAELRWDQLRTSEAEQLVRSALEHARAAEDRIEERRILIFLASAAFWGRTHVEQAIATCEEIRDGGADDQLLQATIMRSLAGLRAMRGELDRARTLVASSQRLQADLGQRLSVAHGTQYAGVIELIAGDAETAAARFQEGFDQLEAMKEEAYLSTQAALLGRALLLSGDLDGAFEMTLRSERCSEGNEMSKAEWGPTRARVLGQRGDLTAARALAEEAIRLTGNQEDVMSAGDSLTAAAEIAHLEGDPAARRSYLEAALAVYSTKGIAPWEEDLRRQLAESGASHFPE